MTQLKIIIIAGPNGAGKTTFAREFLPQEAGCPVFVNADLIAAGLSPFAPEWAALQAGHDIPEATVRRRFDSGLRLLRDVYQPLVNKWVLYDNSGNVPKLMDWSDKP
jgi:predicted ABC-type ATPase